MTQEYIREYPSGKILGIIETYENGDQTARDFTTRRILGYYKAALNITTDDLHRTLSKGNTVVSLIYRNK